MDLRKRPLLLVVVVVVTLLIIGAAVAFALSFISGGMACTELGCPCTEDGERPCNTCDQKSPVFVVGFFNVYYECSMTEIITCDNGLQVDERLETNPEKCGHVLYLMGFRIN